MSLIKGNILSLLGRYRFLTIRQLAGMGVANEKTIRVHLHELETRRLIRKHSFRLSPGAGKLPNVYWLTPKGAREVQSPDSEPVTVPQPRQITSSHFHHRMLTVDALIAADACWNSLEFNTYMEWKGEQATTGLRLGAKNAIADGILRMTDAVGVPRTYILEVYCNAGRASTTRKQLEAYIHAGTSIEASLGLPSGPGQKGARVLVVCDSDELRRNVIDGLLKREDLPPLDRVVWRRFLFKAADEILNFREGWLTIDGNQVDLPH